MKRFCFVLMFLTAVGCGGGNGTGGDASPDATPDSGVPDAAPDAMPDAPPDAPPDTGPSGPPETLDGWALFADAPNQVPADGVVPYELISPLFTDFALKHRFIALPEGEVIGYSAQDAWTFPVGTILIKTFAYPVDARDPQTGEQLLETRLLVHEEDGWKPHTYIWNDEQTVATRVSGGAVKAISWIDAAGETQNIASYRIPSNGECRKCHGTENTRTLGPSTPQLNRDNDYGGGQVNQIDHFASLKWLDQVPPPPGDRVTFVAPDNDDPKITDTERARAYMHSNCAHCHSPMGEVAEKELFLDYASTEPKSTDPFHWGVCKFPTSAGNADCESRIDIIPGDPDGSLLICRVELVSAGLMPPAGRTVVHPLGIQLMRAWISEMNLPGCSQ